MTVRGRTSTQDGAGEPGAPTGEPARLPARAAIAVLVVLAGVLRFAGIDAKSLWGDEFISLALATGHSWYPWRGEETELFYSAAYYRDQLSPAPGYLSQRLLDLLEVNDQLPLYYVLLNVWVQLFGTSEAALRSLSVLASVASIPVLYALGRRLAGGRAGLLAASIFALAPFQVAFALFNRPYALLGFLALLSTLAAVQLSGRGARARWLWIYGASATLGLYTQYLFVWNLLFQVPLVAWSRRGDRRFLVRFGLTCAAAAAIGALWTPMLLAQARFSRDVGANSWFYWYAGSPSPAGTLVSIGHTILKLLSTGGLSGFCNAGDAACRTDAALTLLMYAVPLLLCGLVAWTLLRHVRRDVRWHEPAHDPWIVCVAWTACIVAGPVVMDAVLESHMVYSHRYFISASGPVYLMVAMALTGLPAARLRRAAIAAVLAFLVAGSLLYFRVNSALMYDVDVRSAAAHVDRRAAGAADLVLVLDPGVNPLDFAYYLTSNPDFARVDVPAWRPSSPDVASQLDAITRARPRERIWYVDDRGFEAHARNALLAWLRSRYSEVEATEFTNLGVHLFTSAPAAPGAGR